MRCPKCGADNPESAEFCSLCTERLRERAAAGPQRAPGAAAGEGYIAPSEWRGDAEVLSPKVSRTVESKVKRYRTRIMVYGGLVLLVIAWLVVSFTVWGNPSPGEVAARLVKSLNAQEPEAFLELFQESDRVAAQDLYRRITSYLGSGGRYENVRFETEQPDAYDAYTYLVEGTIIRGGSRIGISDADNLVIRMENREGRWRVLPTGTVLIP